MPLDSADLVHAMRGNADWQRLATPLGFIRLVLLVDWDPIGVFGHPRAMDEYDRYAPEIYDMLQDDAAEHEIAGRLREIETGRMGVRGRAGLDKIAGKLKRVYQYHRASEDRAE